MATAAIAAGLLAGASLLVARPAAANPRPLPFTYPYETLSQDEAEIEQYADLSPVRVASDSPAGTWQPLYRFQTEFEYGITDRLELGMYVVYAPTAPGPGAGGVQLGDGGNGIKQRLRLRLADPGEWPVDVALYGEISELEHEFEIEAKVILQKRFGPMRLMVNLWGEREIPYDGSEGAWVVNPTAGLAYELTPAVSVGAEYWMRAELEEEEGAEAPSSPAEAAARFNEDTHHYLGPAFMLNWGKVWWSAAVYARLDHPGRTMHPGETFGNVWARSVLGLSF